MPMERAFQSAVQLHKAGKLSDAQRIYREILTHHPNHAPALHMLGVALLAQNQLETAVDLIGRSIAIMPNIAEAHGNLGVAYHRLGRNREAIDCYRRALALKPGNPVGHFRMGGALSSDGQLDQAVAEYQKCLALRPDYVDAHINLGNTYQSVGRCSQAVECYQRAIALDPKYAEAYSNMGIVLQRLGRLNDAAAAYQKAVALKPDVPATLNNFANVLQSLGRFDEAIGYYRKALRLKPDYVEVISNLGNAYQELESHDEAMKYYRQALALKPDLVGALNNLGNAQLKAHLIDEAIASFRQAVKLQDHYADAWYNLGRALLGIGEFDECLAAHDRSIALQPGDSTMYATKLFALHYHPRFDPPAILRETQKWNDIHARPLAAQIRPHPNDRSPERKLKIGYVSPDFRDHSAAFFIDPLLANHDKTQFEIYAYANVSRPDTITQRLKQYPQHWRDTLGMTDERVAQMIRDDGIDILIDLAMHMAYNRALVFARKPAPVQVTWLAYPGTTGLQTIDYRLTDPHIDPPPSAGSGQAGCNDSWYSEKSIRLPETFWCYNPLVDGAAVNDLPALATGKITFGCQNNFCKVNDDVLNLWARVLDAVPGSRLILLSPPGRHRRHVLDKLGDRVEFLSFQRRDNYLATYRRIDLGLDTFPYNGHTTSLDSLWMGVPIVTLCGSGPVSRAGLSQMTNLGLEKEFVAYTPDEYVQLAAKWAGDLAGLNDLRKSLRARMEQSALMDGARFARNMESIYRDIWRQYCSKEATAR
jgi:protein O-GlcNAc transferase